MLEKMISSVRDALKSMYFWADSRRLVLLFSRGNYAKITRMKYEKLYHLRYVDTDVFKRVKRGIEEYNVRVVKRVKEKIRVSFVVYNSAMWSCEALLKMMEQDDGFEPYVIIAEMKDGTEKDRSRMYEATIAFFKKNGHTVLGAKDRATLGIARRSHVVFYMTPFGLEQVQYDLCELPMSVLCLYMSYSFMIAERENKFDLPIYCLSWKFFTDTEIYADLLREKEQIDGRSVVFCGHARADELSMPVENDGKKIWKYSNGNKKCFRIVYAPHHSVCDEVAGFSTFEKNYKFMLSLARKYADTTSWVIKPHPLLRNRIVSNGFFSDEREYDRYLEEWNNLPNARVAEDGSYVDILKTSDTMILDSVSFLAEYQYLHKPLLFLTRKSQRFNRFGRELLKVLYTVDGDDYAGIEKYIQEVVLKGDDKMKKAREAFFKSYLEYYEKNGQKSSNDYIMNFLRRELL